MSKALEGTIQIVTARLSNSTAFVDAEVGKAVAGFIHEIYKELSAIERAEGEISPSQCYAVELKD